MRKDLTLLGARIGHFTVIEPCGSTRNGDALWRVKCDKCGVVHDMRGTQLRYHVKKGTAPRCDCDAREKEARRLAEKAERLRRAQYKRDWMESNRLLRYVWGGMKARCYRKSHPKYIDYGGRGITVCDEWRDDFAAFCEWSLTHGYEVGLTLDRVDNNGGYSPDNCRWATVSVQNGNRRSAEQVRSDREKFRYI